jgi:hypothetical protein
MFRHLTLVQALKYPLSDKTITYTLTAEKNIVYLETDYELFNSLNCCIVIFENL